MRRLLKNKGNTDLHGRLEELVGEMVVGGIRMEEAVRELEANFIRRILEENKGNQSKAAKNLGIHRNTLRNKMRRCGLA